jgi:cell division protease FtsH
LGGGHDEREQTLNQILVEMDGFDSGVNIIVVAATNRPDILDPALLRPGRFDRRVVLDLPDMHGRQAILGVHVKGKPLGPDVDAEVVAKQTPGFSGADLANLVNEAALLAARANKKSINLHEFQEAIDRVMAGPERKSRLISARQKEVTAYHEAGHALVGWSLPHADKVHKISIISRGSMGGYTRFLPAEDRVLWTLAQFKDMMTTAMGGRVAELVTFGEIEVTTGASNDLETATRLAKDMVTRYGMSDKLGPRTFGRREEMVFLGREISEQRDYSDKVAEEIDREVHTLVQTSYDKAKQILIDKKESLERIAKYLIQYESVEGEQLDRLFEGPVPPLEEVPSRPTAPTPPYPGPTVAHPAPSMSSQHNSSTTSGDA